MAAFRELHCNSNVKHMFSSKTRIIAGSLLLLLPSSPLLFAVQDNVWTGATSTDWNNPANWSLGRVPTAVLGDNALIDLTSPLATIGPSAGPHVYGRRRNSVAWRKNRPRTSPSLLGWRL